MSVTAFESLANQLEARRQRGLIWLAGDCAFCDGQLALLLPRLANRELGVPLDGPGLIFSDRDLGECVEPLPMKGCGEIMGQTRPWVVFDAFSGFNPNAFAQVAGTIAAGGWLVLVSPDGDQWPAFTDSEYRRLLVEPWRPEELEPRYLTRLCRLLEQDPCVYKLSASGERLPVWPAEQPVETSDPPYLSQDQRDAVVTLLQRLARQRQCAFVLSADRGRGKSAALGLTLAGLSHEKSDDKSREKSHGKPLRVILTAPSRNALGSLLLLVESQLGAIEWQGDRGRVGALSLEYATPAQVAERLPEADLLVIDEAAAIATPLLSALSHHYRRLLFATTQHGYEGNGRGFTLRFFSELRQLVPSVREIGLDTPVRWAPGDPLEATVAKLLLLDVDAEAPNKQTEPSMRRIERLDRDALVTDERLLRQIFGLLVLAHYRTTPGDARVLLDSPNLDVFVLWGGQRLLGCALVAREGELSETLAQGVWEGVRRPTGHLLPQALIAHEGTLEVAPWSAWRIMRIAVHPALQSEGLGSQLLQAIVAQAEREGVDYLGASFAATPLLLGYWRSNGFLPVRVGDQLDPVSGSHAVLVLRALSAQSRKWLPGMRQHFVDGLRYRLAGSLAHLPANLFPGLFAVAPKPVLDPWSERLLAGFAYHQRSLESTLTALDKLLLLTVEHWDGLDLAPEEQQLLVERVWRQKGPAELAWAGGRRAQLEAMRALAARLLAAIR
ncbi:tRNA(Met) cytidine acetyltransferase TmcA [Marinobacterium sp. YM272]|uniref:tRNA(Met) cytidine acetyltransferase TmcA n=1 Tax=Marinobacterium sp. YM272 TaxID=3421654 RepID=UPI003D7F9576